MKTIFSGNQRGGLPGLFFCTVILAVILLQPQKVIGIPRGPLPPFPEQVQVLYCQGFDADYVAGETNDQIVIPGLGVLEESFSGYALQRAGGSVTPFIVPALNSAGTTNISSDTGGSFRCWVTPYWSSGAGNGTPATLLELDAVSGFGAASAWWLQVSPDGNTMTLFNQTGAGAQPVLQAPIAWQAGESHCIALDFSPQGTSLYLDGVMAAQGGGVASVPPSVAELVLGSTLSGANTAGADFDEFYSFGAGLSNLDVSLYYGMVSPIAALGPVSAEEQALWDGGPVGFQMNSIRSPGNVFDPDSDGCGCVTNIGSSEKFVFRVVKR